MAYRTIPFRVSLSLSVLVQAVSMRLLVMLCLGVLWLTQPNRANAQDDDIAARAALAEQLIDIVARENMQKALGDQIDAQANTLAGATEEQRAWYSANALPILQPHLDTMIDGMEQRYAELFTLAELQELLRLYDTPRGRIIAEKQNLIGGEIGADLMEVMAAYVTDLVGKFCARFDCASNPNGRTTGKAS